MNGFDRQFIDVYDVPSIVLLYSTVYCTLYRRGSPGTTASGHNSGPEIRGKID